MKIGSDAKTLATLPSFMESSTIKPFVFSPHSSQQRTRTVQPWENEWREWFRHVFPSITEFAPHHERFWKWVWSIDADSRPHPFVAIWPRGGGKSSSAEIAAVALAARGIRRYILYVSGTQEQADKHLDAIAAILESPEVERYYPEMAERALNKFGSSRGWRRNRLTTAAGVVIDAVGLRTGARGVKFEQQRPDLIILDDVDELDDSPEMTAKKIETFTKTIMPTGGDSPATLAIQNLIIPDGLFARLAPDAEEPATFLADRIVSGPIPAVRNLEYTEADGRVTITGGDATWPGQSLDVCQQQINDWGIDAFLAEAQHNPRARGETIVKREWFTGQNRYNVHDERLLSTVMARFMSWDTAESTAEGSAYSAVTVGDLVPYRGGYAILVREVWRDRVEFVGLLDAMETVGRRWGFHERSPQRMEGTIVEYASSGRQVVQLARANVGTLRLQAPDWLRDTIRPFTPKIPKDARGQHASRFIRAGRVWLPEPDASAPWLVAFEQELYDVPQSKYRDQTDSLFQLILSLQAWLAEPGDSLTQEAA